MSRNFIEIMAKIFFSFFKVYFSELNIMIILLWKSPLTMIYSRSYYFDSRTYYCKIHGQIHMFTYISI